MRLSVSLAVLLLVPVALLAAPRRAIVHLNAEAALAQVTGDRPAVIRALQETARLAQESLVLRLASRGTVIETRLWAANALIVRAEPEVLAELAADPAVAFVEDDKIIPLPKVTEEEIPSISDEEIVWGVQKIGAPAVWSDLGLSGEGVTVAVIDTGIDGNHPDLAGKVVAFKDFIGTSTTPIDGQGHGTHTAGTIAGTGAGGRKTGVAPQAKLIIARVFGSGGASTANLIKAMEWIMDPDGNPATNDGPQVCSNSWGSNSQTDKSFWKVIESWRAANIFPSFAAGNAGPRPKTVGIPGGYPHAFAAGATDSGDGIASFSSRGPITWDGTAMIKPDVSAPGHAVISCKDGGGYRSLSGTSMACPHVTGLVALMVQGNPGLKVGEIEQILRESVLDLGDPGNDNNFGRGRIDARRACASLVAGGVAGTVKDAEGKPVAASIKVDLETALHTADAAGKFKIRLGNGAHTLVFSAYGYRDAKRDITVANNAEVTLDVTMEPVPTGIISGRVMSKVTGSPIPATVLLVGSQLAPVQAAANGSFTFKAPHGKYTLVARSRRFGVTRQPVELTGDIASKLEMPPVPPLLLVNASNEPGLSQYYARILAGAVSGFDTHEVSVHGALDTVDGVYPYETVVWFTGKAANALNANVQKALTEYLSGGGRLLLSGQDISTGLANSAFLRNTLHATLVSASVSPKTAVQGIGGDPIGHGIGPFSLQNGNGANNQLTPDALGAADAHASPILRWQTTIFNRYSALRVQDGNARAVYFGFGLESVASDEVRTALIQRSLTFLRPGAAERADRLATLSGEARADYIVHLEGWLGVHADGTPSRELCELAPLLRPEPALRDLLRRARE